MSLSRLLPLFAALLAAGGCAAQTAAQVQDAPSAPSASTAPSAPPTPPTPASVTPKNPGGDAEDPTFAALTRLAAEPWGRQNDREKSLHVPLVDWKNWRGIKIFGHPTRAAYRYGEAYYAAATVLYTPIEGPNDPEACLAKTFDAANPLAEANGVRIGGRQRIRMTQSVGAEVRPMVVELLDGRIDNLLRRDDYLGALAAYQSFPGTCLVHGFAVVATDHPELAAKVRNRWIAEGAGKLTWQHHVKQAPEFKDR